MINFKDKTIKEIKIWAWAAAVLPVAALWLIFCIWYIGTSTWLDILIIAVATIFFTGTVIWWWWMLLILRSLTFECSTTNNKVMLVSKEIQELKKIFRDLLFSKSKNENGDK